MDSFALIYAVGLFVLWAIGLLLDGWRGRKVTLPRTLAPLPRTLAPLPRTLAPLPRTLAPLPRTLAPLPRTLAPLPRTPIPIKMAIGQDEIDFATKGRVWAPGAPHHGLPMPRPGKPSPLTLASRRSPHPATVKAAKPHKGPQPRCPVTGRFIKRSAV